MPGENSLAFVIVGVGLALTGLFLSSVFSPKKKTKKSIVTFL